LKALTYLYTTILISLLFIVVNISAQIKPDPSKNLPDNINGWSINEADRHFDNETLYDYIDGSAEMFLSFGFSKVFNRIYSRANQPDIIVDIFYMNSSYDAFGVFTHSVGKLEHEFGQQSQKTDGAIIFWKSNYYVSILCHPETPESKEAISKLAGAVDKSINEAGHLPEIIKYLPKENLVEESVRYFRHYNWQNSHTFISNDNIFNIDQNTHGILARYKEKNENAIFLIIMYPNNILAESALKNFTDNYKPEIIPEQTIKLKNGLWFRIQNKNNFIVGIFDSSSKEFADNILYRAESIINK
jgi:hypothetical protein